LIRITERPWGKIRGKRDGTADYPQHGPRKREKGARDGRVPSRCARGKKNGAFFATGKWRKMPKGKSIWPWKKGKKGECSEFVDRY